VRLAGQIGVASDQRRWSEPGYRLAQRGIGCDQDRLQSAGVHCSGTHDFHQPQGLDVAIAGLCDHRRPSTQHGTCSRLAVDRDVFALSRWPSSGRLLAGHREHPSAK
jgi:hypothetical protein